MRNTILLSLLLGLTWVMALIPYSLIQQYISVILNASVGIYILGKSSIVVSEPSFMNSLLAYSVVANRKVRGGLNEKLSEVISTYVGSNSEKVHLSIFVSCMYVLVIALFHHHYQPNLES